MNKRNKYTGRFKPALRVEVYRLKDKDILAERDRLRQINAELRALLTTAQELRPRLLTQYGAVPECVLDFCNRARALAKGQA